MLQSRQQPSRSACLSDTQILTAKPRFKQRKSLLYQYPRRQPLNVLQVCPAAFSSDRSVRMSSGHEFQVLTRSQRCIQIDCGALANPNPTVYDTSSCVNGAKQCVVRCKPGYTTTQYTTWTCNTVTGRAQWRGTWPNCQKGRYMILATLRPSITCRGPWQKVGSASLQPI